MKMIEFIRKTTAEVIDDMKAPFRMSMISRTFDSLIDKAEETRLDVETSLLDERKALSLSSDEIEAKAHIKQIVELQMRLAAAEANAKAVGAEKVFEFGDAPAGGQK